MIGINEAFARGRLKRYMFIELGSSGLFALFTVILIAMGDRRAPFLGYIAAFASWRSDSLFPLCAHAIG